MEPPALAFPDRAKTWFGISVVSSDASCKHWAWGNFPFLFLFCSPSSVWSLLVQPDHFVLADQYVLWNSRVHA